jgi:hypothetical protein
MCFVIIDLFMLGSLLRRISDKLMIYTTAVYCPLKTISGNNNFAYFETVLPEELFSHGD